MISEITPQPDETERRALSPDTLDRAVRQLHEDGYVIVRGLCPAAALETVAKAMDDAFDAFQRNPGWIGGGRIIGHLNAAPPQGRDFIFDDILVNPIVFQITEAALGRPVVNVKYGANVNLPGSVAQMLHSDVPAVDEQTLVVNIPLGDVGAENGATQLVAGTHKRFCGAAETFALETSGKAISALTRQGDVLIRYPGLLHRGMPNPSARPRHMLGMWHVPVGSARDTETPPIVLKEDCRAWLADHGQRLRAVIDAAGVTPFSPNYFPPGLLGAVRETLYRAFPAAYRRFKVWRDG